MWRLLDEDAGEAFGGMCLKLQVKYSIAFPMLASIKAKESAREYILKSTFVYFSEKWILPLAVLFVIVVYSAMATVFYNRN